MIDAASGFRRAKQAHRPAAIPGCVNLKVRAPTKSLAAKRRQDAILISQRGVDMGSQVTLPLWAVIIVAFLAALAAVDRILMPSVRWAMRRRANRAIDEL